MGYHLSKKNLQILLPYLKILESSKKDVIFQSPSPYKLQDLFRNAFNTTHTHLKSKYRLKLLSNSILCEYVDLQISLGNVVEIEVDVLRIADDILNQNYPIIYKNTNLSSEDVASLSSILPSHLSLSYNPPVLEINYDTDES